MVAVNLKRHILLTHGVLHVEDLQRCQKHVARLEKELDLIDRKMLRIVESRRGVMRALLHYKSRLAPIHCLPSEVVAEILLWAWFDDGPPETVDPWQTVPLALAPKPLRGMHILRVCKRWYNIAMSTPAMWARMRLVTTCFNNNRDESLKAWLSRTGGVPLQIAIKETGLTSTAPNWLSTWQAGMDRENRSRRFVFKELQPHMKRCSHLAMDIQTPTMPGLNSIVPFKTAPFAQLEYLGMNMMPLNFPPCIDLSLCPNLRVLEYRAKAGELQMVGEALTVRELIVGLSLRQLLKLLRLCPNTTTCKIRNMNLDNHALTPGRQTHMTETFHLHSDENAYCFAALLNFLIFPLLKKFTISMPPDPHCTELIDDIATEMAIITFFRMSGSQLTELRLSYCHITEIHLLDVLLFLPSLQSLVLAGLMITSDFWEAMQLIPSQNEDNRSLNLRTLDIRECGKANEADMLYITSMLTSRSSTTPLMYQEGHLKTVFLGNMVGEVQGRKLINSLQSAGRWLEVGFDHDMEIYERRPPMRQL